MFGRVVSSTGPDAAQAEVDLPRNRAMHDNNHRTRNLERAMHPSLPTPTEPGNSAVGRVSSLRPQCPPASNWNRESCDFVPPGLIERAGSGERSIADAVHESVVHRGAALASLGK